MMWRADRRRIFGFGLLLLVSAAFAAGHYSIKWLARHAPARGAVTITDIAPPQAKEATQALETQIFNGCVTKAELTLYAAQEKIYNNGNASKLLSYMEANLHETEFTLMEKLFRQIGEWVDSHDYPTAKDYSRTMFYECVSNSYGYFEAKPSERAQYYIQRFEQVLNSASEELLPSDVTGQEYAA